MLDLAPSRPGGTSLLHRKATAVLSLPLVLAGCAGSETTYTGDAEAIPATQVRGADVVEGPFEQLPGAADGHEDLAGTAWLARHDGGTTVTVSLTGLQPHEDYTAHVHAASCAEDAGGPHFQFQPGGPTTPPNEIHLAWTADGGGAGLMTAENELIVDRTARAVVVHRKFAVDDPLACADLPPPAGGGLG